MAFQHRSYFLFSVTFASIFIGLCGFSSSHKIRENQLSQRVFWPQYTRNMIHTHAHTQGRNLYQVPTWFPHVLCLTGNDVYHNRVWPPSSNGKPRATRRGCCLVRLWCLSWSTTPGRVVYTWLWAFYLATYGFQRGHYPLSKITPIKLFLMWKHISLCVWSL